MSKERIFELIRKEEVALFVGAGMSLYAGYPLGGQLAKIFFDNLTSDIKNQIDFTSNLPKLAEDIYYIKGGNKNYLIEMLKNEFQKEPTTTVTHQLLAKIPQIKSIITTNYDTLFETTNNNLEVIRKSSDCSTTNTKKQKLFKIHGDLYDTTNIILTNSDYNNYFVKEKENSVFWNTVKTKLVENHVVFVGYAFEDSNIMVVIEKILNELGDNRKEMFFVAPNITPAKLKFLQQKGIEYIQATAEDLVRELYEDLKFNYLPGLNKGFGTADTAFNFAKSNNLSIELEQFNNGIIINGAKAIQGENHNEVKFKFEFPEGEKDKILDSINGKNFDDVVLEGDSIKECSLFMNGIRLKNEDDITKIQLKKVPAIHGDFEIVFEDGFELEKININVYVASPKENEAHLKIKLLDFTLLVMIKYELESELSNYKIEIIPNEFISSVKNGLNFFNILSRFVSNLKFDLMKDNLLFYSYDNRFVIKDDEAFDAKHLLGYFEKLKKIERHFNVRFNDIDLNNYNYKTVRFIVAYIDKTTVEEKFNGMTFENENEEEFNFLIEDKNKVFVISEKQISNFKLHDIDFNIGYLHKYIKDAYVENSEELKNKKTKIFSMKSKSDTIFYQFTDDKSMIANK
jgi:NAD-dependent SIR2 family protein deacetylase